MIYTIFFSEEAKESIGKWKKSNPIPFKKLGKILEDISQHPRTGIAHPEPLVGGNDILYSRRISKNDRIIYEIHDDKVIVNVLSLEGHYKDK